MSLHKIQDKINSKRSNVLEKSKTNYYKKGINDGISDLKYKLKKIEYNPLFTRFIVEHQK